MREYDISKVFESRKSNHLYNTSYPVTPDHWFKYKSDDKLEFDEDLSIYIHIPFCRSLCKFCEYSRGVVDDEIQSKYLYTLGKDIDEFINKELGGFINGLMGIDIGGGTPTSLNDDNFSLLMSIYKSILSRSRISQDIDFIPSIESTPQSLTDKKISMIYESGIRRISIGIQSSYSKYMSSLGRNSNSNVDRLIEISDKLHKLGIKFNLDFMYGFYDFPISEVIRMILMDIKLIKLLSPDQVTLYEFRPNLSKYRPSGTDKDKIYCEYLTYYDELIDLGYKSKFGRNTFSKDGSWGMSSYLENRMNHGSIYKGFGISSQSMGLNGISYNVGKLSKLSIKDIVNSSDTYEVGGDTYILPITEIFNKFIAISSYSGGFNVGSASRILGLDLDEFMSEFSKTLDFVLNEGYMKFTDNSSRLQVTDLGMRYHGAVFSLFYYE